MGDNHLSELCRKSEVEPIQLRLKQLAGDDVVERGEGADSDPVAVYLGGIWGYRDGDGRTAFHWAIALKNFDLATTLMNAPYCAPVLSEDNDSVTPFATACTVGAPEPFVSALLEKSVVAYPLFIQCPSLQNRKPETFNLAPAPEQNVLEVADAAVPIPEIAEKDGGGHDVPQTIEGNGNDAAGAPSMANATQTNEHRVLNHEDELGNTPLIHAVSRGHKRVVRFLLQKGADLEHQNGRGQTALHRAVSRGDQDLVETLVQASEKLHGASGKVQHRRWVNAQDYRGDSALFYASMENNEDVGRFLLNHGADRELRNKEGKQFWEM